jgi:hypothetical protein
VEEGGLVEVRKAASELLGFPEVLLKSLQMIQYDLHRKDVLLVELLMHQEH